MATRIGESLYTVYSYPTPRLHRTLSLPLERPSRLSVRILLRTFQLRGMDAPRPKLDGPQQGAFHRQGAREVLQP